MRSSFLDNKDIVFAFCIKISYKENNGKLDVIQQGRGLEEFFFK